MRHFLLLALAALLLAGCSASIEPTASAQPAAAPRSSAPARVKAPAESGTPPVQIRIPSAVGEVLFLHERHFNDRKIGCVDCHHQIDAKKLETPHPEYLTSSWINCTVCHKDADRSAGQPVYSCSECHRATPVSIADETLSAKVVVHRQCWKCHPVSTGADASRGCVLCHSGKKSL